VFKYHASVRPNGPKGQDFRYAAAVTRSRQVPGGPTPDGRADLAQRRTRYRMWVASVVSITRMTSSSISVDRTSNSRRP